MRLGRLLHYLKRLPFDSFYTEVACTRSDEVLFMSCGTLWTSIKKLSTDQCLEVRDTTGRQGSRQFAADAERGNDRLKQLISQHSKTAFFNGNIYFFDPGFTAKDFQLIDPDSIPVEGKLSCQPLGENSCLVHRS